MFNSSGTVTINPCLVPSHAKFSSKERTLTSSKITTPLATSKVEVNVNSPSITTGLTI